MEDRQLQQIFDEHLAWKPDGEPSETFMLVHQIGISICWSLLANIIIMYSMYQYRKYAFYIHVIIGSFIAIYTLSLTLPILIVYGLKFGYGDFNMMIKIGAWIGLSVVILIFLVVISGGYTRIIQQNKSQKSSKILSSKLIHKILGYTLTYVAKVNVITGWYPKKIWLFFLAWEICFLILLIVRKIKFPTLQQKVVSEHIQKIIKNSNQVIPLITHPSEFNKLQKKYVIFSDYLYDVTSLEKNHPAGYQIIKAVEGREIDRFIYGMYSAELLPEIPIYSHSYKSMELVGKPIAKLSIRSPYPPTPQVFNVIVKGREIVSVKGGIHVLWMQPTDSQIILKFEGYTNVNQLGQYFALCINEQTTRLYTSVNFLTIKNIELMREILCDVPSIQKYYKEKQGNVIHYKYIVPSQQNIQDSERCFQYLAPAKQYMPLMLKKYSTGKLTPCLLEDDFNGSLKLSCPKGLGLDFSHIHPGKIIIVAGGTGLYPFMDLIDLLYKTQLCSEKHQLEHRILVENPILMNHPFQGFNFILYAAFQQPQDLHPITMQQISYISKKQQIFKSVLRFRQRGDSVKRQHQHLNVTTSRFDKILIDEAKKEKFQKIWICGPPILNTEIAKSLLANGFSQNQFLLI